MLILVLQIYKKKLAKHRLQSVFVILLFIGFLMSISGCYKKQDTILQVYVRDSSGVVVEGAKVDVFAEPTTTSNNALQINMTELTDESGTATFNFNEIYKSGQTGTAIVKAKATYYSKTGQKVVQVIEETNNECFIEIQ
jgi:hypothetical protein